MRKKKTKEKIGKNCKKRKKKLKKIVKKKKLKRIVKKEEGRLKEN